MSGTFSKAIFGVGVVLALAAFISIYVTSIAQDNPKIQGNAVPSTVEQSLGASTAETTTTNRSSSNPESAVSSITILKVPQLSRLKCIINQTQLQFPVAQRLLGPTKT
jgi:hypothetical protein